MEPFCCVVQSRHLGLIGCKPNGTPSFLGREFAFQFSLEVSESCEFCSKHWHVRGLQRLKKAKGVKARMAALTLEERKELATKAARARWAKAKRRKRSAKT